jgi:RNA polymerase sigma-70 factor (ECF subfamily)
MISFGSRYKKLSDEELMKLVRQGCEKALDELYFRYHQRIYNYLNRMLNNDIEKTQDFLQDIFLKIIEKPELFDDSRKFGTWIYAIAHNMCKNEYRRMTTRRAFLQNETADNPSKYSGDSYSFLEKKIDLQGFHNALMKKLQNFEDVYRHIFVLRFHENLTIQQISEITGCKEGTVKSRLFYMTRKLAEQLEVYNPVKTEDQKYANE